MAVAGDRVFMVTDHAHIIALDRFTGTLLWDTEMADWRQNYGATSAPLAVGGLVVSGTSGGDEGVRGFLAAFDQATGKEVWRFWTVPKRGEPGSETWKGKDIDHPCASTWLTGTYDPELDTLYWPTGNPCPDYDGRRTHRRQPLLGLDPGPRRQERPAQVVLPIHAARRVGLGRAAAARARGCRLAGPAAQAPAARQPQRLLLRARPHERRAAPGEAVRQEADLGAARSAPTAGPCAIPARSRPLEGTKVCPAVEGATNWFSTSFNPTTGLYYVQTLEKCTVYTKEPGEWQAGKSYYGGNTKEAPDDPAQKILRAIDVKTGAIAWELPQTGPARSWGGTLATATGLVFFGEDSGALMAVDASTRRPALALPDQHALEGLAHDLHVRRQAAHRRRVRPEHHLVRVGGVGPLTSA